MGTPPLHTRVPYPGSLTEEIIERGEPAAINEIERISPAVAPYLAEACARCAALVVPLLSQGELLGSLVLLRERGEPKFTDGDLSHARILADLASVSLRRVLLLQEAERSRAAAERALRVRDEVLGIVSHDLRNPLSTILMASEFLLEAELPEAQRVSQIEIVRRSAGRMNRLIQDLLDVARLEGGRLAVERRPLPTAALLREACESHRALAERSALRLACETEEPLPVVHADRDRLLQVLGNLIGNAIKFTRRGGSITVRAEPAEGAVHVSVRDSGVGIPAADLPCLFDPYWQATRTAHLGAGLGLSISKGIVEAHGGRIWVESQPEVGSTFHFTIPSA